MADLINRYIYILYIVLIAVIIGVTVRLLIGLKRLSNQAGSLGEAIDGIKAKLNDMKEKRDYVDHSLRTSYSFFAVIIGVFLILKNAAKDYRETKDSKKSISKSIVNGYVHQGPLTRQLLSGIKK